jgi:hypothetical protein
MWYAGSEKLRLPVAQEVSKGLMWWHFLPSSSFWLYLRMSLSHMLAHELPGRKKQRAHPARMFKIICLITFIRIVSSLGLRCFRFICFQ